MQHFVPDVAISGNICDGSHEDDEEICVVDNLMGLGLNQISINQNDQSRWLDLVFTNNWNNVSVECSKNNLLPNEIFHKALEINLEIEIEASNSNEPKNNFEHDFSEKKSR